MRHATSTADVNSDWRDGFLFVGNQLALDLVNTRLALRDEPVELIPDFPALVRWFCTAGVISNKAAHALQKDWKGSTAATRANADIKRFRETLREEIIRWESGQPIRRGALEAVNRILSENPLRKRLRPNDGRPGLETFFVPERPEDLLAPLGDAAANLFANTRAERVRKCAHCVAHFYDNSKKGNRRWCSMQICGNRQKVAAYAARQRRRS
jgi:predicted RNA-binding Zn ribbon-like protein